MPDQEMLFALSPKEHLILIRNVLEEEMRHRIAMCERHPEKCDYWTARCEQIERALASVEEIAKHL